MVLTKVVAAVAAMVGTLTKVVAAVAVPAVALVADDATAPGGAVLRLLVIVVLLQLAHYRFEV